MDWKKGNGLSIKKLRSTLASKLYGIIAVTGLLAVSAISSNAVAQEDVAASVKTAYGQNIISGPDPVEAVVTKQNPTVTYHVQYSGHGSPSYCNPDPGSYTHDKNSAHRWYWSTQKGLDPASDTGWTPYSSDWHKCLKDSGSLDWPITFTESSARDVYIKADICAITHDMFGTNPGRICAHSPVLHVRNMMVPFVSAAIIKQPADTSTSYKYNPCNFISEGVGSLPLTIQWQRSKRGGPWEDIPGANSPKLSAYWEPYFERDGVRSPSVKPVLKSAYSYRVNYANGGGTVTSRTATCSFVGNIGAAQ